MTDPIFRQMAEQMRPTPELREELFAQLEADAEPTAGGPQRTAQPPRRWGRWLTPAVAAITVVGLIGVGVNGGWSVNSGGNTNTAENAVADYGTLYTAVRTFPTPTVWDVRLEDRPLPGASAELTGSWSTNVQVRTIDEGDLVKSDGRSIFIASGKKVAVVDAAGDGTRVLARIDTSAGEAGTPSGDRYTIQGPVIELILRGTTLVVLVSEYQARTTDFPGTLPMPSDSFSLPFDASLTKALIYDVSDPSQPRYQGSLGQSGGLVTTRLTDNVLYLVSRYTIADPSKANKDDPATFVPVFTRDRAATIARPGDCVIMPAPSGPTYTVVSSIDLDTRARMDSESVFGGASTVYMSPDNLYLAAVDGSPSKDAAEKAHAPEDVTRIPVTHLARIAVRAGQLSVAAQGSVAGTVVNQFALDEWDGHLRIATTMEGQDASHRWLQRAALWVLDADLDVAGKIGSLAKNEAVQSVRFDGGIGYVVTFRQTDPLFAIDLSDPSAPRVLSELKLPGFSSYLHPWADGRLLGLGRDATSKGEDRGLKLSMFDTSDPLAVRELTTVRMGGIDSAASNDHRAVLADPAAGLVGFPVTDWKTGRVSFEVYRYDPTTGFALVGRVKAAGNIDQGVPDLRGLSIDGRLYVASARSVMVYQLDGFVQVAKVALDK